MVDGILASIRYQIEKIKYLINNGGLSDLVINQLWRNQERLEELYDKMLNSAGILNEQERQEIEMALESAKMASMAADAKKSKRKFVYIAIGCSVVIVGIIIYIKLKK